MTKLLDNLRAWWAWRKATPRERRWIKYFKSGGVIS